MVGVNVSITIFIILIGNSDLCNLRLQTWFPFEIQVYINGREYLSKQLDKQGLGYQKI
jgi:hypothetical protein